MEYEPSLYRKLTFLGSNITKDPNRLFSVILSLPDTRHHVVVLFVLGDSNRTPSGDQLVVEKSNPLTNPFDMISLEVFILTGFLKL